MSLITAIGLFLISAVLIGFAGTKLSRIADQLADMTGLGEALFGAVLLGGVTSLSGIITSVTAAYNGHAELAVSNAIGGIAAQTLFLCIADLFYRKANLEHASASIQNLMQGILLIIMLGFVLLIMSGHEITVFHIHPASFLIILAYFVSIRFIHKAKDAPMWKAKITNRTIEDKPDIEHKKLSLTKSLFKFFVLAIIVGICGYIVAKSGVIIASRTGLSESFVGSLMTSIATSLPELVVSVAAVRRGAVDLAVGNIIGGNTFDVLFIAFADLAFLKGSIFHNITHVQTFIISLTILMTSILLLGLLHRQKRGIFKIGWESFLIILIYIFGNFYIFSKM